LKIQPPAKTVLSGTNIHRTSRPSLQQRAPQLMPIKRILIL